ncbi:MAG: hypothetical protein ACFFFK_00305 [Candidatus Thorarchaeota archaeon]
MNDKWKLPEPKILFILILIACAVVAMSIPRFAYVYPDSSYYLDLVSFLSGTLSGSELTAPFCYRPLLPLIASVLPFPEELTFAVVNLIFLVLIGWIIFYMALKRNPSPLIALVTTLAFVVSLMYIFYGAVVLVDPGAVFFLILAYYYMTEDGASKRIALFLTLGVFFKEVALIGVLSYLLYARFKEWWLMIPPAGVYAILRLVTPSGNPGYVWTFHLQNLTTNLFGTMKTFAYGMGPFLILLLFAYLLHRRTLIENGDGKWLISTGLPALAYLVLGLFFAHFDVRFLWPTYLMIVPLCADGVSEVFRFLRLPTGSVTTTE